MITFLVFLIIVLSIIAFAQVSQVFHLAAELKGGEEPAINTEQDNRMNGWLMLVFLVAFMAFCVWQVFEYKSIILPEAASNIGKDLDWLMGFNLVIISFVFIVTEIILFYFAFKYYGRKDSKALYYPHNNKLEMIWTIVPAIVLTVIIIYGLKTWNAIMTPADSSSMVVELYSKQFEWTARYSGKDNTLGKAHYRLIQGSNDLGIDSTDAKGWDDIISRQELHLPIGKDVQFIFRSQDVIHSAYFPHFRAQMNTVPGQTTLFHFTPTITTKDMRKKPDVVSNIAEINSIRAKKGEDPIEFDYVLMCNKICGARHYNMQMKIIVESQEEFDQWISQQQQFLNKATGQNQKPEAKPDPAQLAIK